MVSHVAAAYIDHLKDIPLTLFRFMSRMENNNTMIPHTPNNVNGSFQKQMPNKNGINIEKETTILVKAIGPTASALNPVCMEIQREMPYPTP